MSLEDKNQGFDKKELGYGVDHESCTEKPNGKYQ